MYLDLHSLLICENKFSGSPQSCLPKNQGKDFASHRKIIEKFETFCYFSPFQGPRNEIH